MEFILNHHEQHKKQLLDCLSAKKDLMGVEEFKIRSFKTQKIENLYACEVVHALSTSNFVDFLDLDHVEEAFLSFVRSCVDKEGTSPTFHFLNRGLTPTCRLRNNSFILTVYECGIDDEAYMTFVWVNAG